MRATTTALHGSSSRIDRPHAGLRAKLEGMRFALVAIVAALGCHGARPASHSAPPAVARDFPATRWVPANPTYVLASPTVKDAQRSLRDAIDSLGVLAGVEVSEVSRDLSRLLDVDPLSPDPVAGMGIDLDGGIAMFSEDVSPTFVVHLATPEATAAFFDRQRERGLVTQSVIVEGTEIFTAQLLANVKVSWAVAGDWLWVHFTLPFAHEDGQSWFTGSHRPEGPAWSKDWQWAEKVVGTGKPGLVGFLDAKDLIASFVGKVPEAMACAKLLDPVGRVAISIEGTGTHAAGRIALDVGAAAAKVSAAILPAPEGFAALAAHAPLAAQWNVDLPTVRTWLQPCLKTINEDVTWIDRTGVRSARVVLQSLDPDQKSGSGAVAFDLAHKRFFTDKLDDIPLRSTFERSHTFGTLQGHSLSVPMIGSFDYVLTDTLALAAMGDGLLGRLVASGPVAAKGPIAAIDIAPPALSAEAWKLLLGALDLRHADRIVERLLRWHDGHVAVTVEGSSLVLSASGNRR